jgi:8-oxo-dGTP diphosphatase
MVSRSTSGIDSVVEDADTTRRVTVGVVAGRRILVIRRADGDSLPGYWEIPGGGVEPGETFDFAARRELEEETGIRSAGVREILHEEGPSPPGFHRPRLEWACFLISLPSPPEVRLQPGEHSDFRWVTREEVPALRMMAMNRSLTELALRTAR